MISKYRSGLNSTVTEIHGRQRISGVTVAEIDQNGQRVNGTGTYVACDTLLLSVGLIPENELTGETRGQDG